VLWLFFSTPKSTSGRLRVVFLLPTLDIGGAERVALRTAAGLDPDRFDARILALVRGSGRLSDEARESHVAVESLADLKSPLLAWSLFRWLRRHPTDVVLSYMFHANLAARLVGRLAGVGAIICSERVVGWETSLRIAVNRLTLPLADAVTTNSAAGVEFWSRRLGVAPWEVRLIHNGVDTARFAPVARHRGDAVVIGSLARLHPANGHETLLLALRRMESLNLPAWRCVVGGDGGEATRLRSLCRTASLDHRVTFAGHVTDSVTFLRGLDLFVQPSLVAGMPNAVLEAMATALPVVATAVGGTPEVVDAGNTGLLVDAGDADALCTTLASLVRDPLTRARMGQAGRERIEALYGLDRMVGKVASLIEETAARGQGL
jgi:glycosyltransferase involved in cell wall biosynthesis